MPNRNEESRTVSRTPEEAQRACEEFNAAHKVGDRCRYYSVKGREAYRETMLQSIAWVLPSGMPVVQVRGVSGGVSIDHVTFEPPHPLHDFRNAWISSTLHEVSQECNGDDSVIVRFKNGKMLLLQGGVAKLFESEHAMAEGLPPLFPAWGIDIEEMDRKGGV